MTRPRASKPRRRARLAPSGGVLSSRAHENRLSSEPVRTCVGCRECAVRSVLLRVVVASVDGFVSVLPDPGRKLPGRGAWLHPDPSCLHLAERRRAFPRALRHPGPLSTATLGVFLATACRADDGEPSEAMSASTIRAGSGSEADEHPMSEHPMSTQQ